MPFAFYLYFFPLSMVCVGPVFPADKKLARICPDSARDRAVRDSEFMRLSASAASKESKTLAAPTVLHSCVHRMMRVLGLSTRHTQSKATYQTEPSAPVRYPHVLGSQKR